MKSWNSEVLPVHASKIYNHITLLVVWQPQPQEHKCVSLKYDSGQPSVVQKPLQQSEVTSTHHPPPSWGSSHCWKITSYNNGAVCDAFCMLATLFSLSAIGCRGHSIAFSILKWKRWWKLAENSASYWDFSDSHRSYAEEKKRQTLAAGAIWGLCSLVLLHTHKHRHTRTRVCSWSHVHTAFRCCLSDTQDVLSSL